MGALKEMGVWSGDDGQGSSVFWGDRGAWKLVYGALWLCPSPLICSELMFLAFFPEILSGSVGVGALQARKERSATAWRLCGFLWKAKLTKAKCRGNARAFPPQLFTFSSTLSSMTS